MTEHPHKKKEKAPAGGTPAGAQTPQGDPAAPAPALAKPAAPATPASGPAAPPPPTPVAPAIVSAAGAPAAKPPAPKPKVVIPEPVFNPAYKLTVNRYWPTDKWAHPWSVPGYKLSAAILVFIVFGGLGAAAVIGEVGRFAPRVHEWITSAAASLLGDSPYAGLASESVWDLLKGVLVLAAALLAPVFLVWWERKISAHIQSRLGPMYTGGWHGWLQTLVDGIKLFFKEDITPASADRWVHLLSPIVVVFPCILAFAPVSFGKDLAAADLDVGVLYVFAISGISVIGIMMAGWGSGNKYSLLGGMRSAAQLVSYELPRAFSVVPVVMFAGSLNLTTIVEAQSGYWGGVVPRWFLFYPVIGQLSFLIFLTASVAETNRVPFDLPEAESELVAGFHTEFSGFKFALFFTAEYAYVFLASCLTAAFFLGGGGPPLPWAPFGAVPSWAWFLGKVLGICFCFLWFRWTFPRFRVDRVMDFNWKFLLPWTFGNIAFAGIYLLLA